MAPAGMLALLVLVKSRRLMGADYLLDKLRGRGIALEPELAIVRVRTTPCEIAFLLRHTRSPADCTNQEQRSLREIIHLVIEEKTMRSSRLLFLLAN